MSRVLMPCFADSCHNSQRSRLAGLSKVTSTFRKSLPYRSSVSSQYKLQAAILPDEEIPPPVRDSKKFFLFLTIYVIVPFFTCSVLNVENDIYQISKQQFNNAMASGFDPQTSVPGSPEYATMSNLYNESMQSLFVLLLSKRLALYLIATVATVYAGWRSYDGISAIRNGRFSGPGEVLDRLNGEVLDGEPFVDLAESQSRLKSPEKESEGDNEGKNAFAILIDQNGQTSNAGKIVAIGLPLALTASLAASYSIVSAGKYNLVSTDSEVLGDVQSWISMNLPFLTTLPSLILCLLFVSAEFRRVFPSTNPELDPTSTKEPLACPGNAIASLYVTGACLAKAYPTFTLSDHATAPIYLDIWPLQNGVNIALATTVTRALSPFLVPPLNKSIRTVAKALIGVTLFDGISVFGTVANAAVDVSPQSSVMEVVAKSKLATQSSDLAAFWQPGLIEIIVGHNNNQVTEALGLGDVVFPGFLIAWALNADSIDHTPIGGGESNSKIPFWNYRYTLAAAFGYVFASLAMEVVGSFSLIGSKGGLPALVFLVPAMLICVTAVAWQREELQEVWGDVET